jgi:hypothetical protein
MVARRRVSSPFELEFFSTFSATSRQLEDLSVKTGEGICWCSEFTFPSLVEGKGKRSGKSSISLRSRAPALG